MFILVTVVEREISMDSFHTFEEAQTEMNNCFYMIDGIEELVEDDNACLDKSYAWCNAKGGDLAYDFQITKLGCLAQ